MPNKSAQMSGFNVKTLCKITEIKDTNRTTAESVALLLLYSRGRLINSLTHTYVIDMHVCTDIQLMYGIYRGG